MPSHRSASVLPFACPTAVHAVRDVHDTLPKDTSGVFPAGMLGVDSTDQLAPKAAPAPTDHSTDVAATTHATARNRITKPPTHARRPEQPHRLIPLQRTVPQPTPRTVGLAKVQSTPSSYPSQPCTDRRVHPPNGRCGNRRSGDAEVGSLVRNVSPAANERRYGDQMAGGFRRAIGRSLDRTPAGRRKARSASRSPTIAGWRALSRAGSARRRSPGSEPVGADRALDPGRGGVPGEDLAHAAV
jgi:hypothetical protein